MTLFDETYDYIVIGSGSAGSVVASRLSETSTSRVLVIEAGGRDWMPLYKVPLMAGTLFRYKYNNWWYQTLPEPNLKERQIRWPRGKVLGGSNQINGMVYTRGHRLDYDIWQQMGCLGWGYDDILPFFKKSENFIGPNSTYHGKEGPLTVRPHGIENPLYDAFIESGVKAGFVRSKDFNEPNREGFGRYHFTIKNGQRWSSASAFLKPAMDRSNLTVKTKCQVMRILFDGKKAIGVTVNYKNNRVNIGAEREIILCGGAIGSPQLLLLSGVGPKKDLEELDIPIVENLPGVGKNLHDHLVARMQYTLKENIDLYDQLRLDKAAIHVIKALLFGRGLGTSFPLEGGCFIKTSPNLDAPDIQCNFVPALVPKSYLPFSTPAFGHKHGFYNGVHQTQPESRGSIKLRSTNPLAHPLIFANYLATENDKLTMRNGVKLMREVFNQGPIAALIKSELQPGPDVLSDQQLDQWISQVGDTVYHPVGTCKMGIDEMAVVDPNLKIYGLENIRVADASIMPIINGSNTNAPTIMIGEKCSEMIISGN